VADADHPLHRLAVETPGEVDELALGAPTLDATVDEGRNPGRIIAAIFEAPKPFEKPSRNCILGDDTNNSAQRVSLLAKPGSPYRDTASSFLPSGDPQRRVRKTSTSLRWSPGCGYRPGEKCRMLRQTWTADP